MHRRNDQFVGRRFLEHVGDERQLPLADAAFVKAGRIRPRRVGAEIVDIVEHQKQRAAIFERVGGRAERPLEGLARIARVRRLEIEIVIAADIVPRHADLTDDAVEPRIERQIVEHDVAAGDAESGRMIADQARDHIVADEVDFGGAFRLRIGEEEHIEFLRLVDFLQCEVHRVRQRAGGIDAAIAQLQALRRARGLVNVVEARQHLLVDRHRIAGGLDHEDDAFFIDRQRVAPGGIGLDDFAAVGNQDAGDTRIARRAPRAAGAVLINDA